MYFKQILDELHGCASYLIASRQSHETAIVDPAIDTEQYEELLKERDFRLRYVIDTHVHADHLSGARRLAAEYACELCLHESAQVAYAFRPLKDGEELELGQLLLRVLHTPGHRSELEAAPIGWQLFVRSSSLRDQSASLTTFETFATRLLAQALSLDTYR